MALKSLARREDVAASKKAIEREERLTLKIPDTKTPWYLFDLSYADGFVHWWEHNGQRGRVVCGGGMEGKGYAPADCEVCKYVVELYQEAKDLEADDKKDKAIKIRAIANDVRAKAAFDFKAVRGMRMLMKTGTGKKFVADFDQSDSDSTTEVGVLSLSSAQYDGLTAMVEDNEKFAHITSADDLANRVLWTSKETRKGKVTNYSAVVWSTDLETSELPNVEIPDAVASHDLESSFVIDHDELKKVYEKLIGGDSTHTDEDEPVDYEESGEETEEWDIPPESALDDVEGDDDIIEEDLDAADDADARFEDDIPADLPPRRTRPTSAPVKPVAKPAVTPGKRRM